MVFCYDKSPDPGAGGIEPRLFTPNISGATLELEDPVVFVLLYGVVIEQLAGYIRESIVRPYLWHVGTDRNYLYLLLPRGVVINCLGLAGVVNQIQGPIRIERYRKCWGWWISDGHQYTPMLN